MNDVDDDLEFYAAIEDELYRDSDGSGDAIDSELEAELYQSVHFASSFVEAETENVKQDKTTESSTLLDQEDHKPENLILGVTGKESSTDQTDGEQSIFFVDKKADDGSSKYPEVKSVFSNEKNSKSKLSQERNTNQLKGKKHDTASYSGCERSSGNWDVIDADLAVKPNSLIKKGRTSYVRCFNCNEKGHRTFDCTKEKKEQVCFLCGGKGHARQKCPNELCFNCQEPGHRIKKCKKPRCRPDDTCNRCHASGHHESLCPDKWRQYHLTTSPGNIIVPKQNFKQPPNFCYNCGEKGHLGHECWEECKNGHFYGSFPFVVKYDTHTSSHRRASKPIDRFYVAPVGEHMPQMNGIKALMSVNSPQQEPRKSKKRKRARKKVQPFGGEQQNKRPKIEGNCQRDQWCDNRHNVEYQWNQDGDKQECWEESQNQEWTEDQCDIQRDQWCDNRYNVEYQNQHWNQDGNKQECWEESQNQEWIEDKCDMLKQQLQDGCTVFWSDSDLCETLTGTCEMDNPVYNANPGEKRERIKQVKVTTDSRRITLNNTYNTTMNTMVPPNAQKRRKIENVQQAGVTNNAKRKRKKKKNNQTVGDSNTPGPNFSSNNTNEKTQPAPKRKGKNKNRNRPRKKKFTDTRLINVGFV